MTKLNVQFLELGEAVQGGMVGERAQAKNSILKELGIGLFLRLFHGTEPISISWPFS